VTKLHTKRDFRDMLEHCHPTLEHFCTPSSQYEFNDRINVKNECLSQNSTGFEFLRRLQILCFQLLHVNDLMEVVTENLFHLALLLILHQNYCTVIFVNNQLDTQLFFMYVYFCSLHVSGSHVPIIRRINCITTTSGVCHSV